MAPVRAKTGTQTKNDGPALGGPLAKNSQGVRVSTRSMSRHQASKLVARIKRIRDDPSILLPEPTHEGSCFSAGLERKLQRVAKGWDSRARLRRLSRRGPNLVRAYAGALDLLHGEGPEAFVSIPNPTGGAEVKYAQRGNARREVQAGVQNYTDPGVRLLAFVDYAQGIRGHYIFSTDAGLLCAGRDPTPPRAFLAERAAAFRPTLQSSGDDFVCSHLRSHPTGVPRPTDETHLEVRWAKGTGAFRLCTACASDGNLSLELRKRAIGPKIDEQVEVSLVLRPRCAEKGTKTCHFERRVPVTGEDATGYRTGKLTDRDVLEGAMSALREEFESEGSGFVLAAGECLGNDPEMLVERLGPEEEVARAVRKAISGAKRDVVLDSFTASKLLQPFMESQGAKILEAACGDREVARSVLREARPNEAPSTLIQKAVKLARHEAIESELPTFDDLGDTAAFADRVARAYRRGGKDAALREVEAGRTQGPAAASAAWALLSALDQARGREWQFSKVEMERGEQGKESARRLLDCRGEDYAETLKEAMMAVGSSADVKVTTT